MKKILFNLLKIYCLILVTTLIIVGLKKVTNSREVVLPLLFLPIFGYLTSSFSKVKPKISLPLLVYSLLFSVIIIVAEIINIRQVKQIFIVLATVPLPLYFISQSKNGFLKIVQMFKHPPVSEGEVEVVDESRRKFIKIAAGTSLATAIMLFLKRKDASAAFFGSIPGSGTVGVKDSAGHKVDPAQKQPLDGYNISDIDDSGTIRYFGFINKDGAWYILQEDTTNSTIRYRVGDSSYLAAWGVRASGSSYSLFNDVF
jgi:hypothetical protein